jgi:hypothetical protein
MVRKRRQRKRIMVSWSSAIGNGNPQFSDIITDIYKINRKYVISTAI